MQTRLVKIFGLLMLVFALPILGADRAVAVVTFDWATIGDPGNVADTLVMAKGITADGSSGYGSVGYEYRIAKTHVTNAQYTEFLNAVDPDGIEAHPILGNRNGIYNPNMGNEDIDRAHTGGIDYSIGSTAGSKYSLKSGQENYPAIWVNWASSARFVNWLHNGQGTGDTENGVYDLSLLSDPFTAPATFPPRQAGAKYFIPSEDEFYKAAYYDPTKDGGAGGYWQYGVQSDSAPVSEGPAGGATSANYAIAAGPTGVTGDTYWQNGHEPAPPVGEGGFDGTLDHLTDVGAYTSATSHYGLHDVDGLAYQWTEGLKAVTSGPAAGIEFPVYRGGSWFNSSERNGAAFRALYSWAESASHADYGLRIASAVPLTADFEPDGDVDSSDLATLESSFSLNDGADTDGDLDTDGADFLAWQREFTGDLSTLSSALNAVPEPSSAVLLLSLAVASVFRRCRT